MLKFWPFPLLRNYRASPDLSQLFLDFAAAPDLTLVSAGPYRMTVSCARGELQFWSANAYYAWAKDGSWTAEGKTVSWSDEMPSRYAVRAMRKAVSRVRFALPSREGQPA